ncbi:heavy metal-binding domain-containing protein [Caldicellulosiruptoraceae bacterium PP1]
MIISTTPSIEGKKIINYLGIVSAEVVLGVNFVKDFLAGLNDLFGGRSGTYENELIEAKQKVIDELVQRATIMGANAVVGIDLDFEVLGANGSMLMVVATGTAVIIE